MGMIASCFGFTKQHVFGETKEFPSDKSLEVRSLLKQDMAGGECCEACKKGHTVIFTAFVAARVMTGLQEA